MAQDGLDWVPAPASQPVPVVADFSSDSGLDSFLKERSVSEVSRSWLCRVCWDSLELFESLPMKLCDALVEGVDRGRVACCQESVISKRSGIPPPRFPRLAGVPPRSHLSENVRQASTSFADSLIPGPSGMLSVEGLAAGRTDFTGSRVAFTIEAVFHEESWVRSMNNTAVPGAIPFFTFPERCQASGVAYMIPAWSIDRSAAPVSSRRWNEAPIKRIALMKKENLAPLGPEVKRAAIRHPLLLSVEASLRLQLQSISGSFANTIAGLKAWGAFCSAAYPASPHFPACDLSIAAFASMFRNPSTFQHYLQHVRKGEDLLRLPSGISSRWAASTRRGLNTFHTPRPTPRLSQDDVRRLVEVAVSEMDGAAARMYIVCFSFLFRVASECSPLQWDGRAGIPCDDIGWHSQVRISSRAVTVILRTRKNSPHGATLVRRCVCGVRANLFCGACALSSQVRSSRCSDSPAGRVFGIDDGVSLAAFQRRCSSLGLPICGWHAFRRGGAEFLLESGQSLGFVLHAGGWRSAAFLKYISREKLDTKAAFEVAASLSDSD